MAPVYIAIALVCGYIFANLSPKARYRYKRSDGWDAYFYVAYWGGIFLFIGWVTTSLLSMTGIFRWCANAAGFTQEDAARLMPIGTMSIDYDIFKTLVWIALSLLMAKVSGIISRYRFKDHATRANWLSQVVRQSPDESLLVYAASTYFPLLVTLSSRKVYIGVITMPALENGAIEHIELLPILSGYRNKDELTLHLTTNYYDHYEKRGLFSNIPMGPNALSINNFRVVIPAKEIDSMSLFDRETYNDFKAKEEQDKKGILTTAKDNVLV